MLELSDIQSSPEELDDYPIAHGLGLSRTTEWVELFRFATGGKRSPPAVPFFITGKNSPALRPFAVGRGLPMLAHRDEWYVLPHLRLQLGGDTALLGKIAG